MGRRKTLALLLDDHWAPDVDWEELLHDPGRYVLIERYPIAGHHYLSTHDSPHHAANYHQQQEDPNWVAVVIIDLEDTSKQWDVVLTAAAKERG